MLSRQGVHVAFVGLSLEAQTSCAEYLVRKHKFKRMDLEEPLVNFIRTCYFMKQRNKIDKKTVRKFYHAMHKLDPDMLIHHFEEKFKISEADTVVYNVTYLNELEVLRNLGFHIVRVTDERQGLPAVERYVAGADKGTVALSMMYDRRFAASYNVDYSLNYTNISKRSEIMEPLLANLGYKSEYNLT